MTDRATIEALTQKVIAAMSATMEAAAHAVVEEAFRAGEAAARHRVLAAINGSGPEPPAMIPSPSVLRPGDETRRAPRGLTKEVVTRLLVENPDGLPLEKVQELAVKADSRLAEKTVYNELMRGRMAEYRLIEGKWWLALLVPNVKTIAEPVTKDVWSWGSPRHREGDNEPA